MADLDGEDEDAASCHHVEEEDHGLVLMGGVGVKYPLGHHMSLGYTQKSCLHRSFWKRLGHNAHTLTLNRDTYSRLVENDHVDASALLSHVVLQHLEEEAEFLRLFLLYELQSDKHAPKWPSVAWALINDLYPLRVFGGQDSSMNKAFTQHMNEGCTIWWKSHIAIIVDNIAISI